MDYLWTPWRYAYLVDAEAGSPKGGRKGVPQALSAWPGDCDCVFCNLLAATRFAIEHGMLPEDAERAAYIVLQAEHSFICLNAFPYSTGHVMIVPYAHQETLAALDQEAALEMMTLAQRTDTGSAQGLRTQWHQHGAEPWTSGRRRHRRPPTYACAATLAGRFQLHDGDCRDTGAARDPGNHLGSDYGRGLTRLRLQDRVEGSISRSKVMDGCPMFAAAYMGRKRCVRMLLLSLQTALSGRVSRAHSEKLSKGLTPHRFRPTYARANVGHPSGLGVVVVPQGLKAP